MNQLFQYWYALVILCNIGEAFSFELRFYTSAREHLRTSILSNNIVLLESINTVYKYWPRLGDLVKSI